MKLKIGTKLSFDLNSLFIKMSAKSVFNEIYLQNLSPSEGVL